CVQPSASSHSSARRRQDRRRSLVREVRSNGGPSVRPAFGRAQEGGETLVPTRKFQELLQTMPAERQQKIAKRVRQSLAAMPLDEIRKAGQMTQARLADTLGVNQGEVSKIEHRTDIYISTLAGYIEALGGKLEIRAVFPDREMRIDQFEALA